MAKLAGIAVAVVVTAVVLSGQALADADFCESAADCKTKHSGKVSNDAAVVVKKVTIHQEAEHGCPSVEKTHTANMAKGTSFATTLNADCSYHFSFETTSGCEGDKSTKVTLSDNQSGKTKVSLDGQCGLLSASTY